MAVSRPDIRATTGNVNTQPRKINATCRQLVAPRSKFINETPSTAPVMVSPAAPAGSPAAP